MITNNNGKKEIVKSMRDSAGKYFSLTTKAGERLCAQYVEETPQTVVIYDRNSDQFRRLNKTSLKRFKMGSVLRLA